MANDHIEPINILLVEDNANDVLLTTKILQHAKVINNLDVVEDGEEALAYLKQEGEFAGRPQPDLILLDLNLPKKNGRELLADIEACPELSEIPVIIQSASDAEAELLRTTDLHANGFITKPFDLMQLIDVVNSIDVFWLSVVKK